MRNFSSKFNVLKHSTTNGLLSVQINPNDIYEAVLFVRDNIGFEILADIVCVDNLYIDKEKRFSLYYIFRKISSEKFMYLYRYRYKSEREKR